MDINSYRLDMQGRTGKIFHLKAKCAEKNFNRQKVRGWEVEPHPRINRGVSKGQKNGEVVFLGANAEIQKTELREIILGIVYGQSGAV